MSISASQVNEFRQKTGVSMMACKKALEEANGDEEKAFEILRKKGQAKASDKAERKTLEGCVAIAIQGKKAVLIKINCETDFVARNEDFVKMSQQIADIILQKGEEATKEEVKKLLTEAIAKLGENMSLGEVAHIQGEVLGSYLHSNRKLATIVALEGGDETKATDVAMHVTAMNPKVISPEEVSDELVAKEKEIWREQLKNEGKPDKILDQIMMGKEKKFREESALIKQPFVKDQQKTVEQYLSGAKVTAFQRMAV